MTPVIQYRRLGPAGMALRDIAAGRDELGMRRLRVFLTDKTGAEHKPETRYAKYKRKVRERRRSNTALAVRGQG